MSDHHAPMRDTRTRPGLAAAMIAVGLVLLLGSAALRVHPANPVHPALLGVLHWTGIVVVGFVTIVMGFSLAYFRWEGRIGELGRRGGSALLLVGLGVGVAALGPAFGVVMWIWGEPSPLPFAGAFLGVVAAGAGAAVLASPGVPARLILTVGAACASGGGLLQPVAAFRPFVGLMALLVLVQAWMTAPPTVPDAEPGALDES